MAETSSGDRVLVSVSSQYGASWSRSIDLHEGVVEAKKEGDSERKLSSRLLSKIRAEARSAHAMGSHSVREQHADGEVVFVITLSGESVRLAYETWGGGTYDRVRAIWKTAAR